MSSDKLTVNTVSVAQQQSSAQRAQATAASKRTTDASSVTVPKREVEPKVASADIAAVATRIESYLKSVNRALEFKVDNASGRTVVTVRDAENGELIRQIPNEEVLRFAQLAEEQTVVLLNEKV